MFILINKYCEKMLSLLNGVVYQISGYTSDLLTVN